MRHHCPACKRSFDEPGFCPYDGKKLEARESETERPVADKQTVLSAFVEAQSNADRPTVDVPTTPAVVPPKIRSYSASESTSEALGAFKDQRSEYDRLVGATLDGRYYVDRKIGEGGMGVVFAARHAVIERPLAIKVLKREVMRDQATILRFVQEAKAASRIGHPNIVEVTDFGQTPDGMTFSVMEYVDGTTLSKAIKHGAPFPPERAIRIAMQIARALGAAHDKGIVHRDLKPENVFLIDRDERTDFVKIVDFGIAKVAPVEGAQAGPKLTRAGSVFGTPEYMAPEQAAGRNDTDRRVDIYALGAILYEMIVGRVPHKSDSTVRTLAMVMLDPITPPSQVHPDLAVPKTLELLIMKCLAKSREDRYATMGDVLAALDKIAHDLEQPEPTISLVPLPPGADPAVVTAGPAAPLQLPRRAKPLTKPLHEPEFVTSDRPPSFDLVRSEPPPDPMRSRRWPLVLLALVLVGGGATALFVALRVDHEDQRVALEHRDAAPLPPAADATSVAEADAGEPPEDAQVVAVLPDAAPHLLGVPRDAGTGMTGPHPKTVTIQVFTRPGEATVYINGYYRGPNEVRIEEPYGVKRTITCKAPHMRGTKQVVFDGSQTTVMCTAVRVPLCVPGLKPNPMDPPCEPDPNQHGPGDPLSP